MGAVRLPKILVLTIDAFCCWRRQVYELNERLQSALPEDSPHHVRAASEACADTKSSIVSTRILGRRTAPIAPLLIPHPRPTWFVGKNLMAHRPRVPLPVASSSCCCSDGIALATRPSGTRVQCVTGRRATCCRYDDVIALVKATRPLSLGLVDKVRARALFV